MTFTLPAALGAWMLYLAVGVLIALIPKPWPPALSGRAIAATAVPLLFGAFQTAQTFEAAYIVAGVVATLMMGALVRKRAGDTT